jgi:DNA/RNA-binding domain of Phe-tRNA-synthetase-like protein
MGRAMALTLSIDELVDRFPDFRAAVLLCERLAIPETRSNSLAGEVTAREARCRTDHGGSDLSAIPAVAAWRSAYKAFGIKKTSYRSSVERLIKRVLADDAIPSINGFVDAYNAVSLSHGLCVGADDLDRIMPPVAFRFSREGDSFIDMAAEAGGDGDDPPKPGEVVLADSRHVLCRRWNWRQDARSAIWPATRAALVTIQSNGWGDVMAAADDLKALVERECGGSVRVGYVDRASPSVSL